MTKHFLFTLLLLLFLGYSAHAQKHKNLSPRQIVTQFYTLHFELKISGLPNDEEFKKIAPYLSPSLQKLFIVAKQKQAKYIKEHPTNKPPWIEGDLFSSSVDGIQTYKIGRPFVQGTQAKIPIRFTYREDNVTSRWTDTILLKRTNKDWIIANIFYETEKEFKLENSLRKVLQSGY